MSNPLHSSNVYTPLPSSSNPLDDSDQPYTDIHGPSPSYPGDPSTSDSKGASSSSRPFVPIPVDNNPESQISFYRHELNYLREENQKLRNRIEESRQQELARLKNQVENSNVWKFIIGFFIVVIGAIVILSVLVKFL